MGGKGSGRVAAPSNVIAMKGRGPGVDSGGRPIPPTPKFKREPPVAPEWLSEDARAEWDRVVPGLSVLDVLKPEDRAVLAAYCETWATFKMATLKWREQGPEVEVTTESNGAQGRRTTTKTVVNPFIAVANAAGKELRGFAAQFGLSPATESALGGAGSGGGDEDNPFE